MWHGMQTDSRAALGPLAEMLAAHGVGVAVPDWDSHAGDGGRGDLLASVDFCRRLPGAGNGLTLVGWSMGGVAAAGLTLRSAELGVPILRTTCLAGAFMARDPISGAHVVDGLPPEQVSGPFTLLHGRRDDVVPVAASKDFAAALTRVRWPVDVVELDTDHGGIAGATYDADGDRYLPAQDATTRATAGDVAALIAATMGR